MQALTQLEAWILSTYQRLERLDAPVFDISTERTIRPLTRTRQQKKVYRLPTDLPRTLQTLKSFLRGETSPEVQSLSDAQRVSLCFRYLASAMRYEPYNENPIHKTVPSARCMYPLSFYLLTRDADEVHCFKYVESYHAMLPCDEEFADVELNAQQSMLVCVAQVWKASEKYGEFAHFPCVLEGGHALAQAGHLLSLLSLEGNPVNGRAPAFQRKANHALEVTLFALPMDYISAQTLCQGNAVPAELATLAPPEGASVQFARLNDLHALFSGGHPISLKAAKRKALADQKLPSPPELEKDVLEIMRARHSGNDRSGMSGVLKTLPGDILEQVMSTFTALRACRRLSDADDNLSFTFAWLSDSGPAKGLYDEQGRLLTRGVSPRVFEQQVQHILPYKMMRFNTTALSMIFFISANPKQAIDRLEDAALRAMHLVAGAAAHDLSLAVANQGMFSRPVRMMREERIEQALPVNGQVLYQVLCGFNRRANVTFEVM